MLESGFTNTIKKQIHCELNPLGTSKKKTLFASFFVTPGLNPGMQHQASASFFYPRLKALGLPELFPNIFLSNPRILYKFY